jgi:hypothetical protein
MLRRLLLLLPAVVFLAVPLRAETAIGYSYLRYLEEGGGNAPLGAFLSMAGSAPTAFELDLGYHHDSEGNVDLHTFTAVLGPRFFIGGEGVRPFLHVLGGARHDRVEGESNTAFGGMAGLGLNLGPEYGLRLRLGGDFQIFFDEGENLKTLRLSVGIAF